MVRSAPVDCFLAAIEIFLMAILSFLQYNFTKPIGVLNEVALIAFCRYFENMTL